MIMKVRTMHSRTQTGSLGSVLICVSTLRIWVAVEYYGTGSEVYVNV